ncbi:glycosyl hydrolase family 25 [Roseibium denhamense]|uniref:Lysozyme n=1 Tax=Roseibium denhamense TaxID=76305 RepID=A0ABY1PJR2_9HYPH|nr:GH25 family lysozyme [Roseibium denhamense]MTI05885.1 glycosyl hydrolase family 25 [Roseibium denhamense]SMP35618.1 lysozyme [Roseibium denhamense]
MNSWTGAGIDVSHYQGTISWETVGNTIDFAMIKASEGDTEMDPLFQTNWAGCKNNGILCGAYHFFLPTDSFLNQADLLISQLQSVGFDPEIDLPPAIDCEEMQGVSTSTYIFALQHLVTLLAQQIGCTPMIYVSPAFWDGLNNPDFSKCPLWIADYTAADTPEIPAPWATYAIWQSSDEGQIDGVAGDVDLDSANPSWSPNARQEPKLQWF